MANEVFANNLEIACKAADGKSVACFPDVCFTPPSPPAGWIPIPYANTAYAKDTANASKTVFISGKPVMKKDVSYFKTSTGNEPAAGPQGILTHVKKGKAYFTSWSMNVKIEGQNVDRHTDMTTHNHGSTANTGPWSYADTDARQKACKNEMERMNKACEKKKEEKKKVKGKMKTVKSKDADPTGTPLGYWKKEHCKGLEVTPTEVTREKLKELSEKAKEKIDDFDVIEKAMDTLIKEIEEMALKKGSLMVAKKLALKPLQAALGPLGWVWGAYDVYDGITTFNELKSYIDNVKKAAQEAKQLGNDIKELDKLVNNFDKEKATKQMANVQKKVATVDACIRARKCQLVSYTQSQTKSKRNLGCCHGQTGHHLVPDSFLKDSEGCKGYKHGSAATVCVEGTSQNHGSHADVHGALSSNVEKNKTKVWLRDPTISYNEAIEAAVKSHREAFPFSSCSEKCLKAQLESDRDKQCGPDTNPTLKYVPIGKKEKDEK